MSAALALHWCDETTLCVLLRTIHAMHRGEELRRCFRVGTSHAAGSAGTPQTSHKAG
jgi:hypothetical protein